MFPENYPKCLEAVSWAIEINGEMCYGINARYNKFCKNATYDNPYFFENMIKNHVLLQMFKDAQTIPQPVIKLIKYISDSITVRWTDDEFIVKDKKIQEDGKFVPKFKNSEFEKLAKACEISLLDAMKFQEYCIEYITKKYNKIIQDNYKNKQKNLI